MIGPPGRGSSKGRASPENPRFMPSVQAAPAAAAAGRVAERRRLACLLACWLGGWGTQKSQTKPPQAKHNKAKSNPLLSQLNISRPRLFLSAPAPLLAVVRGTTCSETAGEPAGGTTRRASTTDAGKGNLLARVLPRLLQSRVRRYLMQHASSSSLTRLLAFPSPPTTGAVGRLCNRQRALTASLRRLLLPPSSSSTHQPVSIMRPSRPAPFGWLVGRSHLAKADAGSVDGLVVSGPVDGHDPTWSSSINRRHAPHTATLPTHKPTQNLDTR